MRAAVVVRRPVGRESNSVNSITRGGRGARGCTYTCIFTFNYIHVNARARVMLP